MHPPEEKLFQVETEHQEIELVLQKRMVLLHLELKEMIKIIRAISGNVMIMV